MSDTPPQTGQGSDREESAPRTRSPLRLIGSIALALAAAVGLYLFQPGWFAVPAAAPPRTGVTPSPSPTPKPKPKPPVVPYIGDERHFNDVYITPLSVQYTHGSGSMVANSGDVYAIVTLQVVNRTGGDYNLVPNVNCQIPYCNFFVVDSLGEKNPPVSYDPYHTRLRTVVLLDSGRQIGSFTFEVPERDARMHLLKLLYYPNPILDANTALTWQLQPKPHKGR